MCGIAGILNFAIKEEDVSTVREMTSLLEHRGPDGEGYYQDSSIALGHRRLKVIDLITGEQPIFNEDGTLVAVYNGEIYNFRELRRSLVSQGHTFSTHSDTEVIVHAYEEYGLECVKLFNGMFAFALWDKTRRRLILARDRLGIKPLYYHQSNGLLVFASEIKAILAHPRIRAELDPRTLLDFLTYQNMLDSKTFFKGIVKLQPSHCIICEEGKPFQDWEYWKPDFHKNDETRFEHYVEKYLDVFSRAVKRHLISDVPLGSYLSGGFDSSSVAAFAVKWGIDPLQTFTGAFAEGERYDERSYSRAVAERIGAIRHEVVISPRDFLESIEKIIYHLDEPYLGMASFSGYHVSKLVSEHATVVLTGHGGDELLGGYPVFKAAAIRQMLHKNFLAMPKILRRISPPEIPRLLYFGVYPLINPDLRHGLYVMFSQKERERLLSQDFIEEMGEYEPTAVLENMAPALPEDPIDRLVYLYLRTYLPTLFLIEDKVGMAHSIEARTPICDNEMVDFSTTIPTECKLHHLKPKAVMKTALRGIIPDIVYHNPKKGFPTPLHLWFRGELKSFVYDTLLSDPGLPEGIFNRKFIRKYLDRFCAGNRDDLFSYNHGSRIYSLICISLWFKTFIKN